MVQGDRSTSQKAGSKIEGLVYPRNLAFKEPFHVPGTILVSLFTEYRLSLRKIIDAMIC